METELLNTVVAVWSAQFENELQVYETEYYNWEEEYHNVKIEYYVGKPKNIEKLHGVKYYYYRVDYDLTVVGVYIDGDIIYYQDDLPESLWGDFENSVHEEYNKILPSGKLAFYGNLIFDYSKQGINESDEKISQDKLLIYMMKMLNPDDELYIDFYLSPDKKTIYVVGDEDVLNKKYKGDSWLAPNLLELVHHAKNHINYQSPEGLGKVVFVKKKNDKKSNLHENKFFYENNLSGYIPEVNYVANKLLSQEFDWFKEIEIKEIDVCSSVRKCIQITGVMKVDGDWGFSQWRKYHYEYPFNDDVTIGDMVNSELNSKIKESITISLSGIIGIDISILIDKIYVVLVSEDKEES